MLKPGDIVRVRTHKSIGQEFGIGFHGEAMCPFGFIGDMDCCSGKIVTVTDRRENGAVLFDPPKDDVNNEIWACYSWHESMFEPVLKKEEEGLV